MVKKVKEDKKTEKVNKKETEKMSKEEKKAKKAVEKSSKKEKKQKAQKEKKPNKFIETITSTGNTYNVDMEVQVKDDNLGKKVSQATADKIGENVYYSVYTSQIEEAINSKNAAYFCKEGDIVSASVKNTNQTISQQLKNFFYTVTGNDSYTIAAEHAGVVTANGK